MKIKVRELQRRLRGHVTTAADALDYFSTDGSIFTVTPSAVVYPHGTRDVQQTVLYAREQAERGNPIGVVARGKGTDQAGGALGDGIMVVFPAHMNKLRRLDKKTVTVQPGLIYKDLQNTLHSHGRFLPPYPSSIDFCTIGGAVSNNACGEKTIKYGATRDFVDSLKVVLSDGSLIETRRLSARQLNRKKGQADFEGQVYRRLDSLLTDHAHLIAGSPPAVSKNAAGYALWRVKGRDGSFDLSQLMVGAQGTLGIITEATLRTAAYNPATTLVVGYFDDLEKAGEAVVKLQALKPSALEVVDYYLLDFLRQNRPATIEGLVPDQLPQIALLIEFDDVSRLRQQLRARRAAQILKRLAYAQRTATEPQQQEALWRIRRSAAAVIWMNRGAKKALPIIEDGVVPVDQLPQFLRLTYKLLKKYNLQIAVWGHAGDANLHMQPFMDLSKKADREKVFQLAGEFYDIVIKLGGSTCGEHNDGLMRSPWLRKLYGAEMYELFRQVKQIFDPHDIMNPGKKTDLPVSHIKQLVQQERHEYSMKHLYDHMPHN